MNNSAVYWKSFIPRSVRSRLRSAKESIWKQVDELVLNRKLDTYRAPSSTNQIPIQMNEPADAVAVTSQIDPAFRPVAVRFSDACFRALICWKEGVPVGYLWFHDRTAGKWHPSTERLGIRLEAADVYLFNLYVAPEFRVGGVASVFFSSALSWLQANGYRRAWGFVDCNNIPARWMYSVHGWRAISRFTGTIYCKSFMRSNRGTLFNTTLLGWLRRRNRHIVLEFLPATRSTTVGHAPIDSGESTV